MRNLVRGYIDVRIDSDSSRYCSYADRYLRNCIQYLHCTKEMIFEHQKKTAEKLWPVITVFFDL